MHHARHDVHHMHDMIFVLRPVIYVSHALPSCHVNFGTQQVNKTAVRAPSPGHVCHDVYDMIFM